MSFLQRKLTEKKTAVIFRSLSSSYIELLPYCCGIFKIVLGSAEIGNQLLYETHFHIYNIAGKGGHIPPTFSRSTPLLYDSSLSRNPRCPIFYRPNGKTKALNESFNQLLCKFLILEEYLLK